MNQEILNRIDALSAKLGVAAQVLWATYIRQARYEAVEEIVWATLESIGLYLLCRWAIRHFKDFEDLLPIYVIVAIFGVLLVIFIIFSLDGVVPQLLNPEYWAFKELMSAVK
jgi:hypothetical protein